MLQDPALQRKIKMAIDIATGMAYLEANNHVHRVCLGRQEKEMGARSLAFDPAFFLALCSASPRISQRATS